jgi:hypothetical protein
MLGNLLLGSAIIVAAFTAAFAVHSIIQTRKHFYNDYIQRKKHDA